MLYAYLSQLSLLYQEWPEWMKISSFIWIDNQ